MIERVLPASLLIGSSGLARAQQAPLLRLEEVKKTAVQQPRPAAAHYETKISSRALKNSFPAAMLPTGYSRSETGSNNSQYETIPRHQPSQMMTTSLCSKESKLASPSASADEPTFSLFQRIAPRLPFASQDDNQAENT